MTSIQNTSQNTNHNRLNPPCLHLSRQKIPYQKTGKNLTNKGLLTPLAFGKHTPYLHKLGYTQSYFLASGNTIPLMELAKSSTIGGIAHLMKKANAGHLNFQAPSPLVTIRKTNTKNQLFLVHGKTGEAFISPRFAEVVDERVGIHVFWAHGVSLEKMMTFEGLQNWAECYVEELRKFQPNGPYALGALCIGYTLAFTMADILIAAGQEVLPIVLLDPPSDLKPTWRERYVGLKRRLQFKLLGRKKVASRDVEFYNGTSSQIDDQQFIENRKRFAWMHGQYKKFNGTMHPLSGVRIAAKATLKSKTNMHLKGFEVMECGNKHKEVLEVQNRDFREAWTKFERQAFGFHVSNGSPAENRTRI